MDMSTNFPVLGRYLQYITDLAIKPLVELFVINNHGKEMLNWYIMTCEAGTLSCCHHLMWPSGGLFESRTIEQLVYGHKEPLMGVALSPDHPSARSFSMIPPNSLEGELATSYQTCHSITLDHSWLSNIWLQGLLYVLARGMWITTSTLARIWALQLMA